MPIGGCVAKTEITKYNFNNKLHYSFRIESSRTKNKQKLSPLKLKMFKIVK